MQPSHLENDIKVAAITEKNSLGDSPIPQKFSENTLLMRQVSGDLQEFFKDSKDLKKSLGLFARKSGVHQKTLVRILNFENRPGYLTVYKIYRCLYQTQSDTEVYEKAPAIIKAFLKKYNPQKVDSKISYQTVVGQELTRDRAFCEIYYMCGTAEIPKSEITERFGAYGLQTLEKMLKMGVLVEVKPDRFKLGDVQTTMDAESLKFVAVNLIESFYKPQESIENGNNYLGIYAEGLTPEAYNEWLRIDEEAYLKKVKLAEEPKSRGPLRAFTIMAIDIMNTIRK